MWSRTVAPHSYVLHKSLFGSSEVLQFFVVLRVQILPLRAKPHMARSLFSPPSAEAGQQPHLMGSTVVRPRAHLWGSPRQKPQEVKTSLAVLCFYETPLTLKNCVSSRAHQDDYSFALFINKPEAICGIFFPTIKSWFSRLLCSSFYLNVYVRVC